MRATELPIHSDPDIMGGTPVFVGARVPFQTLLDYLEAELARVGLTADAVGRALDEVCGEHWLAPYDLVVSAGRAAPDGAGSRAGAGPDDA